MIDAVVAVTGAVFGVILVTGMLSVSCVYSNGLVPHVRAVTGMSIIVVLVMLTMHSEGT